ncbi:SmHox8 (fragment) [Schistosoma mansoni]|uniref:SmHox8 (fragment) n=1 Tax=Schistosoma mansoni TaxID=6183 RepID=UPI00022C8282
MKLKKERQQIKELNDETTRQTTVDPVHHSRRQMGSSHQYFEMMNSNNNNSYYSTTSNPSILDSKDNCQLDCKPLSLHKKSGLIPKLLSNNIQSDPIITGGFLPSAHEYYRKQEQISTHDIILCFILPLQFVF